MATEDDEFQKRLRATFRVEAEEHVQSIAAGLIALEKTGMPAAQRAAFIETVFRAAHSLKGAARAVNLGDIESICQSLEDSFASWKRNAAVPTPFALDAAHRALTTMSDLLAQSETPGSAPPDKGSAPRPSSEAPRSPSLATMAPRPSQATLPESPRRAPDATVRIAVDKLDARLLDAEETIMAKLIAVRHVNELRELGARIAAWRNEWRPLEAEARALRQGAVAENDRTHAATLARVAEFLDRNAAHVAALEEKVTALTRGAAQDSHVIGRMVDDLLEESKQLLLLPFSTIAGSFAKFVRDLSREQGKEAELNVRGGEIEIDKRILEEMKDPLIHLLRNAIDHGIEPPAVRVQCGKPAGAAITLAASRVDGNKVELCVSDDGAGIDAAAVKKSAIRQGLLNADEADSLDAAAARALVFEADVSTSPMITRLSGRGLGLAIVRETAARLGGVVAVESDAGAGTRFRISLPLKLSTFRGIVIAAGGRTFVLPTASVERVARIKSDEVQAVEGRETIAMAGRVLALVRLSEVLELPAAAPFAESGAALLVVVLGTGEQQVAFVVDEVGNEQEILVKPLLKPLTRVRNISGATVLASGQVAPILNVADLLKSARRAGRVRRAPAAPVPEESRARTILVAEDSITSRMLLKNILEAAGYRVRTAVDGIDAVTLLRTEAFDLLVSDVEMPRLNGFDLTATIRGDKRLAELPVVLVTALETREDRERGIDVGANAYVVKSSFDQSDLLDTVRRLI